MAHLGPYVLQIWGVGVVRIIFKYTWEAKKRNHQENYASGLVLLRSDKTTYDTNRFSQLIGVINFTSVTPEISWGIYCVIRSLKFTSAALEGRNFTKI